MNQNDVVIGITNRHAVTPEEWQKFPNGQVPRRSIYRLSKGETLARLEVAQQTQQPGQDDFIPGDLDRAIAQVNAGRGVDERILRSLYGDDLDTALIEREADLESDAVADLRKSAEDGETVVQLILTGEEYLTKAERPQDGRGPLARFEQPALIPANEMNSIQNRILKAMAAGLVPDTALSYWPHRLRKSVLMAVLEATDELVPVEDAAPATAYDGGIRGFGELRKAARALDAMQRDRGGDAVSRPDLTSGGREPASHAAVEPHSKVPSENDKTRTLAAWKLLPMEERVERARQHPACSVFDIALIRADALSDERASLLIEGSFEDNLSRQ